MLWPRFGSGRLRLWILAGLSVVVVVFLTTIPTPYPKPNDVEGGSFRGVVPGIGEVQLDLFLAGWTPEGRMYRDGWGLPLDLDVTTNSTGEIEAALLSHRRTADATSNAVDSFFCCLVPSVSRG